MKFLCAQINPTVGAVAGNAELIRAAWMRHRDACDLIVYPELCLSGYPPEDLVLKPAFMEAIAQAIDGLRALNVDGGAAMLVSTPWRIGDALYNALLLIEGGEIAAVIPKHHLPNYSVFDELRVFRRGAMPGPFDFRGVRLGFMTCEDMWHMDVAGALKAGGAQALIVPNGSPFEDDKTGMRLEFARLRVAETGLPLLYVNQVGGQDELVFDGASFGMDADGSVSFRMKDFVSDEAIAALQDGRWVADARADWRAGEAAIFVALKLGLHDYVVKNGFPGVVLGLSGGIDSALVAAIAAEALGPANVRCVMMPSPYTAQISLDDAQALARNLGCPYDVIPIAPGMDAFDAMLDDVARTGVTHENIQSRLRGMIVMALSNASGAMVVSTGNKSEMAVGYATLYGDMCGGFALLKDLYKTQVYALARWINARDKEPVIPERIITRAPSAELRPGQTDQDSLPPYEILDAILEGLIEYDLGRHELVARGYDAAVVERVWRMLERAEYKRRQAPPGVKITARAFGRDRRYPITNGFVPAPLAAGEARLEKPGETG
ncbi:MAG: NAD+ synthase [Rhodospirillales bacterium]|nr:NAD+ synthase [Alphaproteobacteria bacterium]MCB9986200.1 NAD+ synthase [Rhodospirillales bacterium]USO07243.1 MAG: NAD+ synthase [Rhodospirillales bacterium]